MHSLKASRAYQAASSHRNQREKDADIFRRANAALRSAKEFGGMAHTRAIADNEQLWTLVIDLLRDGANPLPERLRASIISVGLAVKRELKTPEPDLDFLIHTNEQIAAGLSGTQ